ncbi:MAG: HAD-IA family hydrolase [Sphingomonadales bacterium]|jgi:phosphoglycolate phosphatase
MSARPALIFDVDGTLIDSQGAIVEAMRLAFSDHDIEGFDPDKVRRIVGLSLLQAVEALLPNHDGNTHYSVAEAYKGNFRHALEANGEERLFDGIGAMVKALDADNHLMSVATGKSRRGLDRVLQTYEMTPYFISLQTADNNPSKPHPAMVQTALADMGVEPQDAIMIGDTSFDMLMARNAGVAAIGVAWGYHEEDEMRAAGAQHIARDVPHLHQILKDWRVAA